jgi:hypothetical protein
VKGLEADLQKKDDLLSSQDDTRRFYVGVSNISGRKLLLLLKVLKNGPC